MGVVRAIWQDTVVAESSDTVLVEGNHYFPAASVNRDYLRESTHTSVCGWKGTAHYFTLVVNGAVNENAAWTYPEPKPAAANIRGHIAFWRGVLVNES